MKQLFALSFFLFLLDLSGTAQKRKPATPVIVETIDTVGPVIITVLDTTTLYKIYDHAGVNVATVTWRESPVIPAGGFVRPEQFVNNGELWLRGYVVYKTNKQGTSAVRYLNWNKMPFSPPFIVSRFFLPMEGADFKDL